MAIPRNIQIDAWSDVVCPWCWIGKRRLERAFAARPDLAARVRWRAFMLNPDMPSAGMDRQEYLERKFGGAAGARSVYAPIEAAGAAEGLPFRFGSMTRMPSTRDAHRLLCWAAGTGGQGALSEALFEAFFSLGADIGDHEVLRNAATRAGLDGDAAGDVLDSDQFHRDVAEQDQIARRAGVGGVPCFVFAGAVAVPGAASPSEFLKVLAQLCDGKEGQQDFA